MLIRCIRVRHFSSTPFQTIAKAQYDQVRNLVVQGKSSVLDVSHVGMSLLSVCRPTKLR